MANVLRLWRQRMDCKQCAAVQVCVDLVYLRKPTWTCVTSVNITFACKSPEHIVRFMAKLTAGRSSSGLKRVRKHSAHVRRNCATLFSMDCVCGCSLKRRAVSGRHLWRLLWCASLCANASSTHTHTRTFLFVHQAWALLPSIGRILFQVSKCLNKGKSLFLLYFSHFLLGDRGVPPTHTSSPPLQPSAAPPVEGERERAREKGRGPGPCDTQSMRAQLHPQAE